MPTSLAAGKERACSKDDKDLFFIHSIKLNCVTVGELGTQNSCFLAPRTACPIYLMKQFLIEIPVVGGVGTQNGSSLELLVMFTFSGLVFLPITMDFLLHLKIWSYYV